MKTIGAIIILFFLNSWSAFPQNIVSVHPNQDLESHKKLDSIVEYQYFTEFDSIPLNMREYIYNDLGYKIVEATYRWDTIMNRWVRNNYSMWEDFWFGERSKVEWTYDQSGNITATKGYLWDTIGNIWVNSYKLELEYDRAGNKTMSSYYKWNVEEQKWDGSDICFIWCFPGKNEWEYDSLGQCIMEATYSWRDDEWDSGTKYEYIRNKEGKVVLRVESIMINGKWGKRSLNKSHYDKNGNLEGISYYSWNFDGNDWIIKRKIEWTYDEKDQKTSEIVYKWDLEVGDWVYDTALQYLWEYTYNENGGCILSIEYIKKRPPATQWMPNRKIEYKFDFAGNKTREISYDWNNGWVRFFKLEWLHDSLNYLIEDAQYKWSEEKQDWVGREKNERSFDMYGRKISEASYRWDHYNDKWAGRNKRVWDYDSFGNIIREIWYDQEYNNEWHEWVMQDYLFNNDNDILVHSVYKLGQLIERTFYYYQTQLTGIDDICKDDIKVFPNPTSGIINITGLSEPADVIFYNLSGQAVKSGQELLNTIDISDLPTGMYFLQIHSNSELIFNTRIMKR